MNREITVGDTVCVDITAAKQLPVDVYEVMITHAIPDILLAGEVVEVRRDGRYEVDILGPDEAGPARFVVTIAGIRLPRPDGSCG